MDGLAGDRPNVMIDSPLERKPFKYTIAEIEGMGTPKTFYPGSNSDHPITLSEIVIGKGHK